MSPPEKPLCDAIRPTKQAARRHYGSHPYFTKRAWNVVQRYIEHFSAPGDTVLDCFGGSGVTAVESLILRRKAVYVDISEWACFLARQAAIAPVDLGRLRRAFAEVESGCREFLEALWKTSNEDLQQRPVADWYPQGVRLPGNADVALVEDLFTPRMLHGLARLRACIMALDDDPSRELLRLAFSATLVRINRTFLSATNRRESRGGSAVFSIYRYKVAKQPVELPLWGQFAQRFRKLVQAKSETNRLIGEFFRDGETAVFRHGSATELSDWIRPGTIDYIYTDPPYGGHIAYLDLSTMWAAWLGFGISDSDRANEVIEGGDAGKTSDDYRRLLSDSVEQMHETLKSQGWLSVVFAHRDTTYWESLVAACHEAGFKYVNTVVQPVGVVWSMHKKKNPLRVLSGELVLNFRKATGPVAVGGPPPTRDATRLVRECCEREIIRGIGATTETLHHVVVPKLLESGLLASFSRQHGDLTPLLSEQFDFDRASGMWHLRGGENLATGPSKSELAAYFISRFLSRQEQEGCLPTEADVGAHIQKLFPNGKRVSAEQVRRVLRKVGYSPDAQHWRPLSAGRQQEFLFERQSDEVETVET
ncbi:MAG: hypothetical protein HYS13_07680 [Planctomycetia bacterium]|nr:hypothetical protein [Planctomycetia bacterium]